MSSRPWYKRFPSDFITGTISLTLEEAGAYSYIIDLIHDRAGAIPDDPQWIARVCGCSTRKWKTIRERLIQAGKIEEQNGYILSKRAVNDAENSAKEARNLAESGAKGGRKSSEKSVTSNKNNDLEEIPLKQSRTRSQKLEPEKKHIDSDHDEHFETWWLQYPRKLNKAAARKAYPVAVKKSSHVELLAAIMRLGPAMARGDPSFIPHPATWLNGERWHDDENSINPESRPVENRGGAGNVAASVRRFVNARGA